MCYSPSVIYTLFMQIPNSYQEPKAKKIHHESNKILAICACETMERMVNTRLTWPLEKQTAIAECHSRDQRNRHTND